jgi:hypothetical protein
VGGKYPRNCAPRVSTDSWCRVDSEYIHHLPGSAAVVADSAFERRGERVGLQADLFRSACGEYRKKAPNKEVLGVVFSPRANDWTGQYGGFRPETNFRPSAVDARSRLLRVVLRAYEFQLYSRDSFVTNGEGVDLQWVKWCG